MHVTVSDVPSRLKITDMKINVMFAVLWTQVKILCCWNSLSVSTPASRKFCLTAVGIEPAIFDLVIQRNEEISNIYMLFTSCWEVRIEKYSVEVSKTASGRRPRDVFETETKYFSIRTSQPVNNVFIFFCAILMQIRTKFQCCELDLRSVLFVTLFHVWLTNSQDYMTKYFSFWCNRCLSTHTTIKKVNFLKLFIFSFVLQQ